MAECGEQSCIEFQCSKLGRCGRQLEVEKRNLLGATSCGSFEYFSSRIQIMTERERDFTSEMAFKIASARDHWTEVEPAGPPNQYIDVATLKEIWRSRSLCFVEKGISLGRKIGEGGQAEIFEAFFQKRDVNLIAKVFKEWDSLEFLLDQCPSQIFRFEGDCKYIIRVIAGVILNCEEDLSLHGRFAFLMFRYQDDLRSVIDKNMMRSGNREPPFEASKAFRYMIEIACGMKILHSKQTLHRDLKASNILVWSRTDETGSSDGEEFYCAVADYECSIGVLGTTFWRAPEVLRALKDRQHELEFTTKVDVYSYAMTCYEILTGLVPFEGHCKSDYSLVISGVRPEFPSDVSVHMRELLSRCWHAIPDERPEFSEIVETLGSIMTTELNVPQDAVETLKKTTPDYLYS